MTRSWKAIWMSVIVVFLMVVACITAPGEFISAEDYGDDWPLTVESARLFCKANMVWVEVNDKAYPVNGTAMTALDSGDTDKLIRDVKAIWAFDEEFNKEMEAATGENPRFRISINPLIQDGLALC